MASQIDTEVETITPEQRSPVGGGPVSAPRKNTDDFDEDEDAPDYSGSESEDAYIMPRQRQGHYEDDDDSSSYYTDDDGPVGALACCCGVPSCFKIKATEDVSLYRRSSNAILIKLAIICFVTGSCMWAVLGYFLPKEFSDDAFSHLKSTSTSTLALLLVGFFYMLTLFGLSYKTLKNVNNYDYAPVMAISIFSVLTWLISTAANIYCILKVGGWTNYTIFNGDIASQLIDPSIAQLIGKFADKSTNEILQAIFTPQAFELIHSAERIVKFWLMGGWFIFNIFLLSTVLNLRQFRQACEDYDDSEYSDTKSRRSYSSRTSSRSRSSLRSRQSGKSRRTNRSDYPPRYRDISPPATSVISARSKKSAFSTRMKPISQREPLIHEYNDEPTYLTLANSAPGTRQSFAQNALSKRSRASVACADLGASVNSYCDAPSYISTSTAPRVGNGYRPRKNISAREDFLLQP
ncbi:Oidioi.mRNA.OKI2018_I69.chr1.g1576.t2.cds [Oikopleura dioica]|uniref:Oidioi.mRNA.OKI2018_I69.chr1.g1576.t2.cds n=1 Tax=Oikopleura dioica TaxID=34765 RepID=A0ABN7SNB9_OIKDI|nr:Oidioi.mRNA.OKI2018_I69.chr1.g1576.t2.cds [Oikopleura dioica]